MSQVGLEDMVLAYMKQAAAGTGCDRRFLGCPAGVQELAAGTFRLAWNQSVTRIRWLAAKLGLAAAAATGLLSLMATWWAEPIYRTGHWLNGRASGSLAGSFDPGQFSSHGVAPVGYAVFAFALGVTAGLVIRRTVPAMAVTFAVFAAVQVAMPIWIRPYLIPPVTSVEVLDPGSINRLLSIDNGRAIVTSTVDMPGAWVISNQTITAAGHPFTGPVPQACMTPSWQAC